jgi:hypothetical protein
LGRLGNLFAAKTHSKTARAVRDAAPRGSAQRRIMGVLVTAVLTHPAWCDPRWCEAQEEFGYHRGARHELKSPLLGDVDIAAQLKCIAYEPLDEAQVSIDLAFRRFDDQRIEKYHLDEQNARRLGSVLNELLPTLTADHAKGVR